MNCQDLKQNAKIGTKILFMSCKVLNDKVILYDNNNIQYIIDTDKVYVEDGNKLLVELINDDILNRELCVSPIPGLLINIQYEKCIVEQLGQIKQNRIWFVSSYPGMYNQ